MGTIIALIFTLIYLAIVVASIAGLWVLFQRAGKPGWMAIIPILNLVVMVSLAGKEWWWIILFFVPIANIVALIMVFKHFLENYGERELLNIIIGIIFSFLYIPYMAFIKKSTYNPVHQPKFNINI